MAARNSTLEIVRSCVGRRHRITRTEMEGVLLALAASGVNLQNGYVHDSLGTPFKAALAWAKMCEGITCVSVDAHGLRDGQVRFDEPGRMHPLQHAQISFVPADIDAGHPDIDSVAYMRRHAERVLIVRDAT